MGHWIYDPRQYHRAAWNAGHKLSQEAAEAEAGLGYPIVVGTGAERYILPLTFVKELFRPGPAIPRRSSS